MRIRTLTFILASFLLSTSALAQSQAADLLEFRHSGSQPSLRRRAK